LFVLPQLATEMYFSFAMIRNLLFSI